MTTPQPDPESPLQRVLVPPELEGERLDRCLAALLPEHSRSRLKAWIQEGRVRVDGAVEAVVNRRVEAGAALELRLPPPPPGASAEEARARLPVLFADEHLVVIDKPAGLLTHRGEGSEELSLAELADALFGPLPCAQGAERPGIVHRLDRDTSGVIVLGRTEAALEELLRQFREREVEKRYLALVHGEPRFDSEWIEAPIGRSPQHPDRMAVLPEGEGREAATYYEVRERFGELALLECRPRTGRTHQVRVHLASIGFPLLGEPLYRRRNVPRKPLPADAPPAARHLLHASALSLSHPSTGERLAFEAPLPPDFEAWLAWLRRRSKG